MTGLIEVTARHARDAPGAQEGGADRLLLVAPYQSGELGEKGARSPEPDLVTMVCRETDLPVRVVLRLNDTWTTTGGELTRLVGLAGDFLARGAEGVAFGFLDSDLEVDVELCAHLAGSIPGVPWTFTRAIDHALDTRRAWRDVRHLPGLDAVWSAGSPRGIAAGFDDLLITAQTDAALLMPGGGLLPEQVPWFARAGVRQFHLGAQARPGASYKAYVDSGHVRAWRLLLDDALGKLVERP